MVIGGESVGPRHLWWNFVSSSRERIERAKRDWRSGAFDRVPGETEFIPLPTRSINALEHRLALLEERARTLGCVLRRHRDHAVLELDPERLRLGHRRGLADHGHDRLDRERAVLGDPLRDLARLGERLSVGHHVTDEAEIVGAPRRDRGARDEHLDRDVYGIWRGRRTVEPAIGNSPRCTSVTPNSAPSAATRMSVPWRISVPPASA
jgi:hypothetical protein